MRYGITSLIGHQLPFAAFCRLAAAHGFRYVEPSCVRGYFEHFNAIQLAADPALLDYCRRALQENGLSCSAIDAHGLFRQNPAETEYNCRYFQAAFEVALALGTNLVITSIPGGGVPWETMVRRTAQLCQEAAEKGLAIAIEAEYGFAVGTPDEAERFLEQVNQPNLGLNYDPSHFVRAGYGVPETLRRFAGKILHVHLKEYLPEATPPTLFTGECPGSPAWQLLDGLADSDFAGVVSVETLAEFTLDAQELARRARHGIQCWEAARQSRRQPTPETTP